VTAVALKGLLGRKLRTALTGIAIILGVAMVTGAFMLGDTISKAFDSIFTAAYQETDAVLTGKKLVDWSVSGNATVDTELLAKVRALPEVDEAAGAIMDMTGESTYAKLLDRDGKAIQSSGNPTFGFGVDAGHERFNPLRLVEGEWARGGREVVIDAETSAKHGFAVGDSIRAAANGPIRTFRITGIARYGEVSNLGGATFAIWDVPTARQMFEMEGYTGISVAAKDGISEERLLGALAAVAPANVEVRSGSAQAQEDKKGVDEFIGFLRGFLLAFGGIALFVGAFVIFNTLSITVAQRTRELATLRTLGASARQVLRSVFAEAVVLGAVASIIGIGLGLALARGLSVLFEALGLALPQSDPVYAPRTFVIAFAVGVGVTAVAALFPALRATRVPPIAAVREGATLGRRRRGTDVVGGIALAIALVLLGRVLWAGSIGWDASLVTVAVAGVLLLLGIALVASRLVAALASVVGLPSRRLGGAAGRLARENSIRNPARTAATAAALMIGLALVAFVAVLGHSARESFTRGAERQFDADYVVTSQNGWSPLPKGVGLAAAKADGIEAVSSIRIDTGLVGETMANVSAVDPKTLAGMYRFEWTEGSDAALARLDSGAAVVKRSFARDNGLELGQRFTLTAPNGRETELTVAAMYQPPRVSELLGGVVISHEAFDRTFPRPKDQMTLIRADVPPAALESALSAFPDAKVHTKDGYVASQVEFIGALLNLLYVLLALSVVVSLFGMVNTLVLSVFERTRELGLLRAVGMTRRQARRMVRHESVITALIGASLGLPLGILVAGVVTGSLGNIGISFLLPVVPLIVFTLVAIGCGLLAAIAPARRASRLNVLEALQYE
jgi:putative ABC transport system permease protein